MLFVSTIIQTFLDALFPISAAERELFSYSTLEASQKLPKAPTFTEPIPFVYSIFAYKDERVAKLVWNIKYKKSEKAVKLGGFALWNAIRNKAARTEDATFLIVPIPITDRRRKERGYNQCELLVDEIAKLDIEKKFSIKKDLLIRTQHVSRQTLKSREERLQSTEGIFQVTPNEIDRTIPVIIIDDVITTGSTIKEAMQTMKDAGFLNVYGLSLAH